MKLTPLYLSSQTNNQPLPEVISLDLVDRDISHIEDISICINLHKLNLSKNRLKHPDSLSGLAYCKELTLLNVSENALESFEGLDKFEKLLVLNVSSNNIKRLSSHLSNLKSLKALIATNNHISQLENLSQCTSLNTLILSHNQITQPPMTLPSSGLAKLTELKKLSMAHNGLTVFPDLSKNANLKEIRLNDNKILSVPEHVKYLPNLEILDLGNNLIRNISDLMSLSQLHNLHNLTLKGNPVCALLGKSGKGDEEMDMQAYRSQILQLCPNLRILDNVRFDIKFLERKEKRKDVIEKQARLKKLRENRQKKRENKNSGNQSDEEGGDNEDGGESQREVEDKKVHTKKESKSKSKSNSVEKFEHVKKRKPEDSESPMPKKHKHEKPSKSKDQESADTFFKTPPTSSSASPNTQKKTAPVIMPGQPDPRDSLRSGVIAVIDKKQDTSASAKKGSKKTASAPTKKQTVEFDPTLLAKTVEEEIGGGDGWD